MKIWQVQSDCKAGIDAGRGGFYARSKKEIMKAIKENKWDIEGCYISVIDVEPNKDGIIQALNRSQW